jgi:hypothetical protein
MASIHFKYTGSINSQALAGIGNICSNTENGQFTGSVIFSDFPSTFHPAAVGVSLLSVSCTNGSASAYDVPNILTLTLGNYKSIRTVNFLGSGGEPLGQVVIDGTFTKMDDELYSAEVNVSGTYTGPTNLILPFGYDLPLNIVAPDRLQGSFNLNIETESGSHIQTTHTHEFEFLGGTSEPLQDCESQVYYLSNSNWNAANKSLFLPGISIMRKQ